MQIVNGLLDSPEMEAKGALLVRGPWDETSGSPGLLLGLTGRSLFQVCYGSGFSWMMRTYVYKFLYVVDCGFLVQGKARGVG